MAALILTLIATFLVAALAWLVAGSRVSFSPDQTLNDVVNFVVYFAVALPVAFVLVFFGLGAPG